MLRRLLLLLALTFAAALPRLCAATQPDLTSERFESDAATGELIFSGKARLQYETALILADEIRYNPRTKVATAKGHVSLTRGPRRLLADQLTYKLDEHRFDVINVRVGEYPVYLTAISATGNRDRIVAQQAHVSYSAPDPLAPALSAKTLTYIPGQSVTAETARIGLGTTVPVSVPKFEHSLKEPLLANTQVHFGYRASLGAHLGAGAEVPIAPGFDAGGDFSFYTRRGVLLGPSASYDIEGTNQETFGAVRTGYIHDYGDRLADVLARPIPPDRGFIEWDHHQDFGDRVTVFGQLRYWSDSDVVRDFNPDEFFQVQTPDNFFEGLYAGDNYTVSLFTRFQPNNYIQTQQRLPELHFTLAPTPIGLGVYERFDASAAVLRQNEVGGRAALNSTRLDAFYELSRPISPQPWLTLTPVAGGRLTYYGHTLGDHGTYARALGEVGFDAALTTSGVYDYHNERWNIDGIRHLIIPRLSYRYVPAADKGQAYIPDIDQSVFSTYLQPLDIGDQRNIDQLQRTNTLRIGLDNTFQTRDKQYGSRDLLTLNFAADVRFQREVGMNKLSGLQTEMTFTPARWVRFEMYNSVDPKNFSVNELNTGIRLIDSNAWSLRFANHYLAHNIQEYIVDGRYRLNEAYEVFGVVHYDEIEHRFIERTVGLRQNLRNLWSIDYAVSFFSGRRRESDFGFALRVNLIGL